MATRNIQMNYYNGTNYDVLYPQSTIAQISNLQSSLNSKLNLSGGTMTGNLMLNGNPSSNLQAVTKQYADNIQTITKNNMFFVGTRVNGYCSFNQETVIQYTDGNLGNILLNGNIVCFRCSYSGTRPDDISINVWLSEVNNSSYRTDTNSIRIFGGNKGVTASNVVCLLWNGSHGNSQYELDSVLGYNDRITFNALNYEANIDNLIFYLIINITTASDTGGFINFDYIAVRY